MQRKVNELRIKATEEFYNKAYLSSIETCSEALDIKGNDIFYLNLRGQCLVEIGEFHSAIDDFNKSIQFAPNHSITFMNLGLLYLKLQNYSFALINFNKRIELEANDEWAYSFRADTHFYLRDFENAILDISKSIEINGKIPILFRKRAKIYSILNKPHLAELDLQHVEKLIQIE